jgi:hypothetical protein
MLGSFLSTEVARAMSEHPDLVFEVPAADLPALLAAFAPHPEIRPLAHESAGALGAGELVSVLVPIAPALLGFISGVAVAWIRRPGARVEFRGMKVTGASRRVVDALLRRELGLASTDSEPRRRQSPRVGKKARTIRKKTAPKKKRVPRSPARKARTRTKTARAG